MNDRDGGTKVLFILTHRLGDLLQAFPAFALARRRMPRAELHLLCDDTCAPLAGLCPDLDRVHSFPRTRLLPSAGLGAFQQAEAVLDMGALLRAQQYTHVVNLMGNQSAALLGSLAGSEGVKGGGRRFSQAGAVPLEQRWARLLFALPAARTWQPFHLSEVFVRLTAECLGLIEPELPLPGLKVDRLRGLEQARRLAGQGGDGDWLALRRPWVGLQGGASKSIRRPPGAWLRTFGREFLSQLGGSLFLLGTAAEAEAFEPLLQALGPSQRRRCVQVCGALDLPALAALVSNLDAMVSVDTFTLHLASAVGTPVLGLYPGPASPHETGPWGSGHLVLWADRAGGPCACETECGGGAVGMSECWERLHPELAVGALELLLNKGDTAALRGRRVRAFETSLSAKAYGLSAVDGAREREPEAEALSALARAWALGEARPKIHLSSETRACFSDLAQTLTPDLWSAPPDLGLKQDPADWFRAQAMHAKGEAGLWSRTVLADAAEGCGFFADAAPQGARKI